MQEGSQEVLFGRRFGEQRDEHCHRQPELFFVKLTLPFQVVSMWMVRAISQQNGEPELHPREVQARRPSSFVDDLPFVSSSSSM
jgi:hypothetical protein